MLVQLKSYKITLIIQFGIELFLHRCTSDQNCAQPSEHVPQFPDLGFEPGAEQFKCRIAKQSVKHIQNGQRCKVAVSQLCLLIVLVCDIIRQEEKGPILTR